LLGFFGPVSKKTAVTDRCLMRQRHVADTVGIAAMGPQFPERHRPLSLMRAPADSRGLAGPPMPVCDPFDLSRSRLPGAHLMIAGFCRYQTKV
jgi:hypothetical protein